MNNWANMTKVWDDGEPRSIGNSFTGETGAEPIIWATAAQASYATRVNEGLGIGNALDTAGRTTVLMEPKASGLSIATAADKKVKRKQGAAI